MALSPKIDAVPAALGPSKKNARSFFPLSGFRRRAAQGECGSNGDEQHSGPAWLRVRDVLTRFALLAV
tara:strand:+ start:2302 stop:2505 length:204 start_codon:yes stop_codon:yes gene_type:complete